MKTLTSIRTVLMRIRRNGPLRKKGTSGHSAYKPCCQAPSIELSPAEEGQTCIYKVVILMIYSRILFILQLSSMYQQMRQTGRTSLLIMMIRKVMTVHRVILFVLH